MYWNDATSSVRLEVAQILHGHCPSRRQIPIPPLVFLKFIETWRKRSGLLLRVK
jgi:hypothetical protein